MTENPTISVVAAIIMDRGRILAVQRAKGQFKDGWEFPGGKIEDGEDMEDALRREIMEELEVQVKIERNFGHVEYDYENFHLSMDCFICTVIGGSLTLREHRAYRWLRQDELDSVDWLPADLGIIKKLKIYLRNNK